MKTFICDPGTENPADASGRTLPALRLQGKRLAGADFTNSTAHQARVSRCDLSRARLAGADWSGAIIRLSKLHRIEAAGAVFNSARIEDCAAIAADLRGAELSETGLTDSDFARADLSGAALSRARGESVGFSGADLREARLRGCDLPDADFRGADLRGADLSNGRFAGADFRGARLEGAGISGAVFAGARFDREDAPGHADVARVFAQLTDIGLAGRVGQMTGLEADIRARVEAALAASREVDASALLAEAMRAAQAASAPDSSERAEPRLRTALGDAPNLARLLGAARLDAGMLAGFMAASAAQRPPEILPEFLAPIAAALDLPPDAGPQEILDALMASTQGGRKSAP